MHTQRALRQQLKLDPFRFPLLAEDLTPKLNFEGFKTAFNRYAENPTLVAHFLINLSTRRLRTLRIDRFMLDFINSDRGEIGKVVKGLVR